MYDVIIIGAGPGGYVAAIRAAQLGLKTCVIEKEKAGGVCLNWGCIPSKNLIDQADTFLSLPELTKMGLKIDTKGFDYSRVQKKSRGAVTRLVKGVEFLLKKNKVETLKGTAQITTKNSVKLDDGTEVHGRHLIVATGSRPMEVPGFEFDEKVVLSSTGILSMTSLPKSLIILGGGAIGCEFAYVMTAFGVEVTMVEMMDHLLPFEDEETVAVLEGAFKKMKIKVLTGTRAMALKKSATNVEITVQGQDGKEQVLKADKALCVFGRTPNTQNIGLENIGVETEKGYIPAGDFGQTNIKGVFAIGDVVATPLLAHVASREGEIAVEYIAGLNPEPRVSINEIPSAIYCEPQVASFGLREQQAKSEGIAYNKAIFPYQGVGKAVAVGKTLGLVKILTDPESDEILGAHIVGHEATELIHELLLAKIGELLPEDVANMIHAHPTLSELSLEGMRAVKGHAIHI
jgi:dihydrolipoamide dehydrogenase